MRARGKGHGWGHGRQRGWAMMRHAPAARPNAGSGRALGLGSGKSKQRANATVVWPPLAQQPPVRHPGPPPGVERSFRPRVVLPGLPGPLQLVTTPFLNDLLGLFLQREKITGKQCVLARGPGRASVPGGPAAHLRISPPPLLHRAVVRNNRFVHKLDRLIVRHVGLPGHGVVDDGGPLGVHRVGPTRLDVGTFWSVARLGRRAH